MSQRLQTYFPLHVHKLLIEYGFQFSASTPMMKELFITIAFTFVFFPAGFTLIQRRILNGLEAKENEFPYMVGIRASGMYCGGVLLNECFVLTAAHCLMGLVEGQVFTVILGAHDFYIYSNETKELVFRTNMTFWVHENFSMPSAEDDIAIIKLPSCVQLTENINPIKVSKENHFDELDDKAEAVVLGWGMTTDNDVGEKLQTANMKLIPISDCFEYQKHFVERITKKHVCGLGLKNQPGHVVGPCDGDSGSPLVLAATRELIGITSFVKDAEDGEPLNINVCDSDIAPAVYVRVASYLNWISEKTGIQFD